MFTAQARNFERLGAQHAALLVALGLSGVDVSPKVAGADRLVGYGDTRYGYGPACIIDLLGTQYVLEPHITWAPWTTAAQRIGHFKWFIATARKTHHLLFNVEKKEIKFFEHFKKRGLIRKIGVIEELQIVDEIHMYQVKKEPSNE